MESEVHANHAASMFVALLRASTAAWANAISDDLHFCFIDQDTILFGYIGSTGADPLDPLIETKLAVVLISSIS
jgi:hypothetical protein